MKLYYHPVSTVCRPIMQLVDEENIPLDLEFVDLFKGAHLQAAYAAINPSRQVPVLDDGDLRLTECSAILKYLAEKAGSKTYPQDLRKRARVNERMDWVNTQLCRDLAYGLVYPQIFPHHKRPTEEAQRETLKWGKERAAGWLKVMNDHLLGKQYLAGDNMSIADIFAAPFVALAEAVGSNLGGYPKVNAWLGRMKSLKSWQKVNEVIDGYAKSLKGPFEKV